MCKSESVCIAVCVWMDLGVRDVWDVFVLILCVSVCASVCVCVPLCVSECVCVCARLPVISWTQCNYLTLCCCDIICRDLVCDS
jgi:hypothetical protein